MNMLKRLSLIGAGFAVLAAAQDAGTPQRITATFKDPAAPRKLEVNLLMGNVTVRGTERADALVEYTVRGQATKRRAPEPPPPGMHRIGGSGTLDVTEDNNTVRVDGGGLLSNLGDVTIQVPAQTSVTIATSFGAGKIVVENISGEIEVGNLAGEVDITNVSGSVVAHTMNGKVVASLSRVTPGKNMSFSTFNGDIDVTLPADAKANLKARADNGEIYTDFDVKLEPQQASAAPAPAPDASNSAKRVRAKVRRRGDGAVTGTINGGGPEIQFTTFNGRILIHKK
jgi:DUF4097 and DUF4098 domain-containing protein YvlB